MEGLVPRITSLYGVYRRLPLILCYHAVSSVWPTELAVAETQLAAQLAALRRRGYVGLTFAESERARLAGRLPRRTAVVTFDDGFASTSRARAALEEAGFPGTVFVVTDFVESGDALSFIPNGSGPEAADELKPLGWSELAELRELGWEVGSHTVTHPRLPDIGAAELQRELELSREAIERRLGSCETLAYPYGAADERVAAAAAEAGYLAACTLTGAHRIDERFRRSRVGIYRQDAGLRTRVKLSTVGQALRRTRLAELAESRGRRSADNEAA
jgi:peptidoglycan/xylan/chitin deacetylase (PgdA/CDA1 family)